MSCENLTIVKGEDRKFIIKVSECPGDGPYDLTDVSEIKVILKGAQVGTKVELKLSDAEIDKISPEILGQFEVTLSDAKSALLLIGNEQNFEIELVDGAEVRIIPMLAAVTVLARI